MKSSVRFVIFEYFAYAIFIKTLNEYCSIRLCYRMNTSEIYLKLLCIDVQNPKREAHLNVHSCLFDKLKFIFLIGGRVCNPRQQQVLSIYL